MGLLASDLKNLFMGLRPSLQDLDGHFIVVEDALVVLTPNFGYFVIHDIAVDQKDHQRDHQVIDALKAVVLARANARLFADTVLERLCVASGGNLRDLFLLIRDAMLSARRRYADAISIEDTESAAIRLRNDYKNWLGSTGQDSVDTPLTDKLDRLVAIYQREDPTVEVPDRVLYLLLKQRCALQYNGAGWIGVHPLVVDLLVEFRKLDEGSPGGSRL